ncbi:MAG: hypothetical protein L6Q37_00010 [Bdellovibrionaceae bacterium]|nr:hypothetical protein [Pseudobdellovibrionaceae bacterium]NUM58511.1 hypothetical protein [Pseudobdellovibrionaceae bacterium]
MIKALVVLVLASVMAQAQFTLPKIKVSPIREVTLVCKSKGATFYVSETLKKFWQSEGEEQIGMDFTKRTWDQGNCAHCFDTVGASKMGNQYFVIALTSIYDVKLKKVNFTVSQVQPSGARQVMLSPSDFVCSTR